MKPIMALAMLALAAATPAVAAENCSVTGQSRNAAKAEGKRFTVVVEGKGPDIILIPGLSTPRDVWNETVDALAGCYRIHSVQIRGFGDDAGVNAEGPVLDPFVTELADYIDDEILNKGGKPPAVIGHSLGGLSALMIGARYPQTTGKIMVVDALPFIGTLFGAPDVAAVRSQSEQMRLSLRARYKAGVKPALVDCEGEGATVEVTSIWSNTANGRCKVENWSNQSDPRVTAQLFYDDMTTDMRPELGKIAAPLTILYAQDDKGIPEAKVQELYRTSYQGAPRHKPVMIKGSFHFIMLDQPEKFRAALTGFLGG